MADLDDESVPVPKAAPRPKRLPTSHPKYIEMVIEAIAAGTDRKGTTLRSIKNHIASNYPTVDPNMMKSNVKKSLEKGMLSGVIVRSKQSEDAKGIQGRFKIDKVKQAALKPKKAKPPAAKAAAKTKEKKPVTKKKESLATKSPKKLKTPKKTSKSKAVKVEKSTEKGSAKTKTKTASKAKPKSPAAKSSTAKKPAAKKTAAKKTPTKKAAAKPAKK